MPDLQLYLETTRGVSPSKIGFSARGGGRSRRTWLLGDDGSNQGFPQVTNANQIFTAIVEILGQTYTHRDGVRLNRIMPKADPLCPWLFADEISEITGRGHPTQSVAVGSGFAEVPPFDYLATYPLYAFDVSSSPRPFVMVQDDLIPTGSLIWYKTDNSGVVKNYSAEWLRFTDVERIPAGSYLTSQAGQFVIDVASGFPPDGVQVPGQLRLLMQSEGIKVTWYQVPYAYIDTGDPAILSYISQGIGCINQYTSFGTYPSGSLLLEGVGVTRYTPPVPKYSSWGGQSAIYGSQKLCDITFIFTFVRRTLGKDAGLWLFGVNVVPPADATPRPPIITNVVQAGHNLSPYAHMGDQYYFGRTVVTNFTNATGRGKYPSFPMELLFTNPGVVA